MYNCASLNEYHSECILRIYVSTQGKTKYISAKFLQSKHSDIYIVLLYNNSQLVQKILTLKKQEYHQRLLVSSINDIIFEINKDGIFLNYWTNKPDILIHPPSTFIGRAVTDMSGWEMMDKVHEEKEYAFIQKCKIFIVSSSHLDAEIQKTQQYPFIRDYVQKPLNKEKLIEILALP